MEVLLCAAFARDLPRAPARRRGADQVSGAHSGGVPPVPIPNTAVKPASADGSRTAGSLESRTPPDNPYEEPADRQRSSGLFAFGALTGCGTGGRRDVDDRIRAEALGKPSVRDAKADRKP